MPLPSLEQAANINCLLSLNPWVQPSAEVLAVIICTHLPASASLLASKQEAVGSQPARSQRAGTQKSHSSFSNPGFALGLVLAALIRRSSMAVLLVFTVPKDFSGSFKTMFPGRTNLAASPQLPCI